MKKVVVETGPAVIATRKPKPRFLTAEEAREDEERYRLLKYKYATAILFLACIAILVFVLCSLKGGVG